MNIKTQRWIVNIAICIWIVLGSMVAFWIYDASSQEFEASQVCRGWHGHKVECE